jgi:GNAT superfamily N-acetyltransferase
MSDVFIRLARAPDCAQLARLREALWPDASAEEHAQELSRTLDHRRQGIGRKLLLGAEDWARSKGCGEIASDTPIDNEVSQLVHETLGYTVVDRCVHYHKVL